MTTDYFVEHVFQSVEGSVAKKNLRLADLIIIPQSKAKRSQVSLNFIQRYHSLVFWKKQLEVKLD